ncbi:MAG: tRNA (adenosine(37)-N6)-dimethylallyltransferase MiaA [Clostridia bacterium]|nr:tRNA (adenosine(37)-N6)-dimethylallyltransferase MiaA [Clostridia bacterium]
MIPLIIVEGPTASGKTDLAVKIAKRLDGEVVSADSMQVYKYMDIGSAKPSKEEQCGVPHHMFDVVHPTKNFSLADYLEMAHSVIKDIHSRGKRVIVAGGTGLYIDFLKDNLQLSNEEEDNSVREKLEEFAEKNGIDALHARLAAVDEISAAKIHPNNVKRVIRALEVYEKTGIKMSEQVEESKKGEKIYDYKEYGIMYDREVLYDRINRRVDVMFDMGLVAEVEKLVQMGCTRDNTSMQGIGYKEVMDYLEGKTSLEETKEIIRQGTRRYAKRQMTWFRKSNITWLLPGQMPDLDK